MSKFNPAKILLIGATSGLGEGFVRRLHSTLPTTIIIITGRRESELSRIQASLESRIIPFKWDITDLAAIPSTCQSLLTTHPDLDCIFINAGIQKSNSFLTPLSPTDPVQDSDLTAEVTTNVTAPVLLTRHLLPHLATLAAQGKQTYLLPTSSGLGFFPSATYASYSGTKAFIHAFCIAMRDQVISHPDEAVRRNLKVCEIVPPWVDTGLDAEHRARLGDEAEGALKAARAAGDEVKVKQLEAGMAMNPTPLDEYIANTVGQLLGEEGIGKELGMGFSQMAIETWRGSFGKVMEGMGRDV